MISFNRPVDVTFYGDCKLKVPTDKKNWEYEMPRGKCILHFFDELDEEMEHVHFMYGYDTIPIRGVQ